MDALLLKGEGFSDREGAFETELEFYTNLVNKLESAREQLKEQLKKHLSPSTGFQETGMFFQMSLELRAVHECIEYFSQKKNVLQSVLDAEKRKRKS